MPCVSAYTAVRGGIPESYAQSTTFHPGVETGARSLNWGAGGLTETNGRTESTGPVHSVSDGLELVSGLERRTATARPGNVRVAELEAGAVSPFDVIDLRTVEVLIAQRVDIEPNTVRLEALVELGR